MTNSTTPPRSGGMRRKKAGRLLPAMLCLAAAGLLAHGLLAAPDKAAYLRSVQHGLAHPLLWLLG